MDVNHPKAQTHIAGMDAFWIKFDRALARYKSDKDIEQLSLTIQAIASLIPEEPMLLEMDSKDDDIVFVSPLMPANTG